MEMLCSMCAMREQGPSGFCVVCEAGEAVDDYRDLTTGELRTHRERCREWLGWTRTKELVNA